MGGIAVAGACPKTGGINARVGIALKEGIGASSSGALSSVYSGGVYK